MTTHGLRSTRSLLDEGTHSGDLTRRVATGLLDRVARGVYAEPVQLPPRDDHVRRARAVLMRLGGGTVLSHATAAIVHGVPVPDENPALTHLTPVGRSRGRRRAGCHVHGGDLDPADVVEVDGLPVTSRARTVADLARSSSFAWGVVAADHALASGLAMEELVAQVVAAARRDGIGLLRAVAAFADGRAESVAESVSRVMMTQAGLPTPELQYVILGPDGFVARADFAWPESGVVGEVDGKAKYGALLRPGQSPADVIMAEKRREEAIRQAGWWPVRWGWREAWSPSALRGLLGRHVTVPRRAA